MKNLLPPETEPGRNDIFRDRCTDTRSRYLLPPCMSGSICLGRKGFGLTAGKGPAFTVNGAGATAVTGPTE